MLPATALAARAATRRLTVLSRHVCTTPAAAAAASGDGGDKSKPKAPRNMSLAARKTVWVMRNVDRNEAINPAGDLKGKTLFITGASRGIGHAIAMRAARDGANVAIAAKTTKPHPKLPGTIYTAADDVTAAGGRALPIQCDIRDEEAVQSAIDATVAEFGGIDILINNASAINLANTETTDMKRYDLMHSINTRGTFLCSKLCIPHLRKSSNGHILNISPPLDMSAKWFAPHVAYTMAKFGMSMCALGMAEELRDDGIAVNTLWPRTVVATSAVKNLLGGDQIMKVSRTPEVMSDAAHCILTSPADTCTGNFFVDDEVLASAGVSDLNKYNNTPGMTQFDLGPDFFC